MATIHGTQTAGDWTHPAPHPGHGSGFGEWLHQIRQARGLSLDDISRETKIPRRNLEALEHGDLGAMPTFYERAEVRAFARVVGIDERVAIGRLDAAMPASEPPRATTEDLAAPWSQPSTALAFVALSFGVLLATAGVGRAILGWVPPARALVAGSLASRTESAVVPARPPDSVVLAPQQTVAGEAPAVPVLEQETVAEMSPASSVTEIVVRTDPPGAHVTVNGISWGVSPVTIRHLSPGAKRVRVTKEGFAAVEQTFALDDGQQRTLDLRLK